MLQGQTCMIVGLSVRCLINVSFAYFLFGTLICSIGFCLNVTVANKLAIVWFPQHDIFKVKSLLIFLLIISESLGYFLSTLFITSQSTRQSVLIFFIVQSSIMIIVQILNMLFFKPTPIYAPNYCSLKSVRNFRQNIKSLVPNFDYLLTFFSMSFIFLNTGVFFVGVTQFQKSYGLDQSLMKTSLLIVCLAGALGTFINCRFLITQYKLKCIICYAINLIGYIHLFIAVQTHQMWLINISTFLIGLSTFPIIALLADYGAQCAFPAGQGTSGGSLFFGGYTFGSMVTLLLGVYIGHDQSKQRSRVTLVMFIVFVLLSFTFLALTDERLKRKNYQERKVIRQKIKLEKMKVFEIQDFLIK